MVDMDTAKCRSRFIPTDQTNAGMAVFSLQIDLDFSVTENMHMRSFVVVNENDNPEYRSARRTVTNDQ